MFTGHKEAVNTVAFSPDGKFFISGSDDKTIRLWEVDTGKQVNVFQGHTNYVTSVAFSPDGNYTLSGSWDKSIRLWHISTGKEVKLFIGHKKFISSVAFSPDGKYVFSSSGDTTLRQWDVNTGQQIKVLKGHISYILSLSISPNGLFAISGGWDNNIVLWQLVTARKIREFKGIIESPNDFINSVALSPNGKYALSGYENNTISLWDISTGQQIKIIKGHTGPVNSLAFSSDSKYFVSGSDDKTSRYWDVEKGQQIHIFDDHINYVSSVALSSDGRYVLTGCGDSFVRLWDVNSGDYIKSFEGHFDPIQSVAISPDSSYILSANRASFKNTVYAGGGTKYRSRSKYLRLWEFKSGKELLSSDKFFKGHNGSINSICFTPDSKYVLSGGSDHTLILWNVSSGRKVRKFKGHTGPVNSLDISSDGKFVVSGSDDKTIKLWKISSSRAINTFYGHSDSVTSVKFGADTNFILSGSKDGTMRLWSVNSKQEVLKFCSFKNGEWITLSPDGYYNSSPEGSNLIYWVYPEGIETFSFEQFESYFKRPDIIKARLSGNFSAGMPAPKTTRPPQIELPDHLSIQEASSKNYKLQLTASAIQNVKTVRVFVNGKPSLEVPIKDKEKELSIDVPLISGTNRITAIAYDEKGFSSNPKYVDVICKKIELAKPSLYIFAIGISNYPMLSSKWQLEYAHTDAKSLINAFQNQEGKLFGDVRTNLLINENATVETISESLDALSAIDENDLAVIFMAGHGIRDENGTFYFLTSEGSFKKPQDNSLSWSLLGDYLSNIKGRVILFLDACHSGSIVTETIVPNEDLAQEFFTKKRGGTMVFSASKGRQYSMESPDIGGGFGIFTYALTQGLGSKSKEVDINGNNFVEFQELVEYVSDYVDKETKGEQTPWLSRKELFGDLPIARVVDNLDVN
jgi:WD40 repeat protein